MRFRFYTVKTISNKAAIQFLLSIYVGALIILIDKRKSLKQTKTKQNETNPIIKF